MDNDFVVRLRAQIGGPRDGALLRFSIGNALLADSDAAAAATAFSDAVGFDALYSAAWKMLGRALDQAGDAPGALDAWAQGIDVAHKRGDTQAEKEMTVFARRLRKTLPG